MIFASPPLLPPLPGPPIESRQTDGLADRLGPDAIETRADGAYANLIKATASAPRILAIGLRGLSASRPQTAPRTKMSQIRFSSFECEEARSSIHVLCWRRARMGSAHFSRRLGAQPDKRRRSLAGSVGRSNGLELDRRNYWPSRAGLGRALGRLLRRAVQVSETHELAGVVCLSSRWCTRWRLIICAPPLGRPAELRQRWIPCLSLPPPASWPARKELAHSLVSFLLGPFRESWRDSR